MDDSIIFTPAHKLQAKLTSGDVTSVQVVQAFLSQIERHNRQGLDLKAVISTCPTDIALERAKWLDDQREMGQVRSELHGIPIVLKVIDIFLNVFLHEAGLGTLIKEGCYCNRFVVRYAHDCWIEGFRKTKSAEKCVIG